MCSVVEGRLANLPNGFGHLWLCVKPLSTAKISNKRCCTHARRSSRCAIGSSPCLIIISHKIGKIRLQQIEQSRHLKPKKTNSNRKEVLHCKETAIAYTGSLQTTRLITGTFLHALGLRYVHNGHHGSSQSHRTICLLEASTLSYFDGHCSGAI